MRGGLPDALRSGLLSSATWMAPLEPLSGLLVRGCGSAHIFVSTGIHLCGATLAGISLAVVVCSSPVVGALQQARNQAFRYAKSLEHHPHALLGEVPTHAVQSTMPCACFSTQRVILILRSVEIGGKLGSVRSLRRQACFCVGRLPRIILSGALRCRLVRGHQAVYWGRMQNIIRI